MFTNLKEILSQYHLLDQNKKVLIAVSGGVDSMVLLDLMSKIPVSEKPQISIAHVNHQLRDAADDEEKLMQQIAQEYGVPLYIHRWEKKLQPETGIEKAARKERYSFFARILSEQQIPYLMTAHHLDDQVETILMRLTRGASLEQLLGIQPRQPFTIPKENGELIRPLLSFSKEEIYAYAHKQQLMYVEDESNQSLDYTRNRFRNEIIPLLKDENNQFNNHVSQFRLDLADLIEIAQVPISQAYEQTVKNRNKEFHLDLEQFFQFPNALQKAVITRILEKLYAAEPEQYKTNYISLIQQWLASGEVNSSLDLTGNYIVEKSYYTAVFQLKSLKKQTAKPVEFKITTTNEWVKISDTEKIGVFSNSSPLIEDNNQMVSEMKISGEQLKLPLTIRHRQPGDRMNYQGLTGHKKIKDIFIDEKIPLAERDQAWLVEDSEKRIIWLISYRQMSLFTESETDKLFYSLKYIKKNEELER